jgi:hypothetical protein
MGSYVPWTNEEYAMFERMRAEGATIRQIAGALQRSEHTVAAFVTQYNRQNGIVRRTLTKEQLNHILDTWAYVGPKAARALAPRYGVKCSYVNQLARNHGVRAKRITPKPRPRYEDPRWEKAKRVGPVIA